MKTKNEKKELYKNILNAYNKVTGENVSLDEILSKTHREEVVQAKHFLYWFLKEYLDQSPTRIGREFGKNHSSILYGINKINGRMKKRYFQNLVDEVEFELYGK